MFYYINDKNIFAKTIYYLNKIYLMFKDIRLKLAADDSKEFIF